MKRRKKRVNLSHDEKRQVARQIVEGRFIKQVAAEWHISEDCARKIVQEYTITYRTEKYPLTAEIDVCTSTAP